MFYGAVSDFFAQAVISFLLGHRNLSVFSEFLQTLNSTDAASVLKLSRIRTVASEFKLSNARAEDQSKRAPPTREAIYVVSFNYSLEKVMEFTRIPLKSITSIQKGAYILSTLQEASRDPKEHALIDPDVTEFYAFKAIPGHTSEEGTCQELVNNAVKQIAEACKDDELIEEKDIVSLAEAESATSILDKMDYAFKRFLWL
ncbi:hypothetical protein I302_102531 [Kwoniella bestiolae CBS 10118]|uniref:Inositol phosphatase domain-containing protein n=1 Tax=Kwoniella bestiolae CBS 10118 TaxID=1296100 RepID=A0AAJ8M6U1_9TREE